MKLTKLAALILVLALVLPMGLTACEERPQPLPSQTPTQTPNQDPTQTPTDGKEEEKYLSLGKIENGVYTNDYIGIGWKFDSSWSVKGAQDLQELPDTIKDMMSGSQLGEALDGYETIIDMQAENVESLQIINVVYTKLKLSDRLLYATMTAEQIVDSVLAQKDMLIEAYRQVGINVQSIGKKTVTYLGKETWAVYTVSEVSGVPYYMLQVYDYHLGAYGYTLTASSYLEDSTQQVLDMVYPLD